MVLARSHVGRPAVREHVGEQGTWWSCGTAGQPLCLENKFHSPCPPAPQLWYFWQRRLFIWISFVDSYFEILLYVGSHFSSHFVRPTGGGYGTELQDGLRGTNTGLQGVRLGVLATIQLGTLSTPVLVVMICCYLFQALTAHLLGLDPFAYSASLSLLKLLRKVSLFL